MNRSSLGQGVIVRTRKMRSQKKEWDAKPQDLIFRLQQSTAVILAFFALLKIAGLVGNKLEQVL